MDTSRRRGHPAGRARTGGAGTGFDVLLLDGAMRQTLAAARSLGRAGLRVAVAEAYAEWDRTLPVPAFASRYTAAACELPDFSLSPDGFARALIDFLREHPTRVVMPASDGSLAALLPFRDEIERHTVLALASTPAMHVALDKQATIDVARSVGVRVPHTAVAGSQADVLAALTHIGLPCVLKPVHTWNRDDNPRRLRPLGARTRDEAARMAADLLDSGSDVLVQEWASGSRESLTVLRAGRRTHAEFAMRFLRMSPSLGGVSTLREAIAVPPDLHDAATKLLDAMDIDGLAEVEFRRTAAGEPLLMEVNPRLMGCIEVAVKSGVDFPRLVWQWATGEPLDPFTGYRPGLRARWLRGDAAWLRENLRQGGLDGVSRAHTVCAFTSEFFRTTSYDLFDRHDLRPVYSELRAAGTAVARKLAAGHGHGTSSGSWRSRPTHIERRTAA